ncbi:centrosomal protein of 104 kDa isoform X2 [Nematostella vectensis]|uniref:centrosomal protein of 104 kDa isoform X2 n=1 Tax=Nematostella vectensis TaxID=45351 RepID=UPI0020773801|nr:centrosomal protein of 104 kDa isoform X2 [Nematostella vectensis]
MPKKVDLRVVHCSGADEGHSAKELEVHSPTTSGWQSSRFCLYPQEIVLQISKVQPLRVRKLQVLSHQYLVATRIEVFVGRVPSGQPVSLLTCKYKRLGYVGLSDNESTQFKARELKSIHLDAEGQFIKLLVHKNYVNRYNLYNQVGLVAVNVIADVPEIVPADPHDPDPIKGIDSIVDSYMKPESQFSGDPIWGKINRPEYVSPLDDLAFDMYQDPETANLIRKLEAKKKEAVQQERYDFAKKLKVVISELYKAGEKLGKYEVEKKRAVEQEDYDHAQEKKREIDEFRLYVYRQLDISALLELDGSYNQQPPLHITSPPLPPLVSQRTPPPVQQAERRSPPIRPAQTYTSPEPTRQDFTSPIAVDQSQNEDRPLPALKNKSLEQEEPIPEEPVTAKTGDGPEPLKENDLRTAGMAVDVFGEHLVQCAFSKQWNFRQEAMEMLEQEMTSSSPDLTSDKEPRNVVRATVILLKKGIKEKVLTVFTPCLGVLRALLHAYIPHHRIGKAEISHVVEKTVPALLVKSGETTPRTRDAAIEMILEMAAYKDVKGLGVIADLVTQPTKSKQAPWRLLKSRLEIIDKLLPVLDVESGQAGCLSLEAVMHVAVPALDHNNGEVRDAAVKLIFELYKKVKDPVKGFLPNDEPATRKNPLYRSIFDGFDHIDGKPTESERRAQAKIERQNAEKHKQAEIEALQAQLQALREMAGEDKSQATSKDKSDKKKKAEEPALDMDKMCIFCGEQNESFTEDMLDLHYWKSCPMLNRCEHCSQVVEVSGFNDHLLTECDAKDRNAQCPRCKEVMLKVDLDDHLVQAGCTARGKDAAICPLCKTKIGSEEEAWRNHLMENCKANKARLQQQQASKAPSRASLRSNRGRGGGKITPSLRGVGRGRKGATPRQ